MHLGVDLVTQFMDVDGGIANIDALRAIDRNDDARFGNFLDRLGLWHVHFNSGLQDRRRDHEDHEEHEHDVHEGDDIDIRKRSPGLASQLWHLRSLPIAFCEASLRRSIQKKEKAFNTENTE